MCHIPIGPDLRYSGGDIISMSAPLEIRTKEKERAVIRFLWQEGVKGGLSFSAQDGTTAVFQQRHRLVTNQRLEMAGSISKRSK